MANLNSTRLSPAELRRKLLAPPTDSNTPIPEIVADVTPLPSRMQPRRSESAVLDLTDAEPSELDAMTLDPRGAPSFGMSRETPTSLPRPQLSGRAEEVSELFSPIEGMNTDTSYDLEVTAGAGTDVQQLRSENAELRRVIEEMRPVIEEASRMEMEWQDKELNFQHELEDRDQQMQQLQEQLHLIEEQLTQVAPQSKPKTSDDLAEWEDDLEKENAKLAQQRRQLDEELQQLREDEESLERQMRQMEVQMAKERAMMARQETELKRLSAEIQHELELMQRGDATLRERMTAFQRRHQDILRGTPGGAPPSGPVPVQPPAPPAATPPTQSTNAITRILRGKK